MILYDWKQVELSWKLIQVLNTFQQQSKAYEKIAVEIKTFLSDSPLTDYHAALGQFLNYRLALEISAPARILYLAVPVITYEAFFNGKNHHHG